MEALQRPVQSNTALLLIAGLIMVTTLWVSKKARTVIKTEVNLGRQGEGVENFGSSALSRVIVRMVTAQSDLLKKVTPHALRRIVAKRLNPDAYVPVFSDAGKPPSFDLLRASVNLIVASAVVSFATSMKLPLSTTYVTFMVAMGTSFSDQAWGRENAVYRVNGVLTVIGGWFVTALVAFSISFLFAVVIYFCELPGAIFLLVLSILLVWRNYRLHFKREEDEKRIEAFSLKTIVDSSQAVKTSFEQAAFFLKEVSQNLDTCFEGMFSENRQKLKATRNETKKIQKWTNIIIANFFKTLYLLHKDDLEHPQKYSYTIQSLQEISESHRDIILRAYNHVENNHRGLLDVQKEELAIIRSIITRLLKDTADMLLKKDGVKYKSIDQERQLLEKRVSEFDKNQIKRIQKGESKTRLSILFYGFLENSRKISAHTLNLVDVFRDALQMMPAEMETVPKNPRI
jgi:Na+/phosphate symporter